MPKLHFLMDWNWNDTLHAVLVLYLKLKYAVLTKAACSVTDMTWRVSKESCCCRNSCSFSRINSKSDHVGFCTNWKKNHWQVLGQAVREIMKICWNYVCSLVHAFLIACCRLSNHLWHTYRPPLGCVYPSRHFPIYDEKIVLNFPLRQCSVMEFLLWWVKNS